jgi:hypothetical protein
MGAGDRADELVGVVMGSAWFVDVLRAVRDSGLPDAWTGAGVLRDLVWGELHGSGFRSDEVRDVDVAFFDPGDLSRERDRDATARLSDLRPAVPWEATNQAAVHTWYHQAFRAERVPPLTSTADGVATWPESATSVAVRLVDADRPGLDAGPGQPGPADDARRRHDAPPTARKLPADGKWPGERVPVGGGEWPGDRVPVGGGGWPQVWVPLGGGEWMAVCAPLGVGDLLDGVWRRNPRRITVELSRNRLGRHEPARRWPGVRVVEP